MKKYVALGLMSLSLFISSSNNVLASQDTSPEVTFMENNMMEGDSAVSPTAIISRMWKTEIYRSGYGPFYIYFNDGYFHGYLQRYSYVGAGAIGEHSLYQGWVFPISDGNLIVPNGLPNLSIE